MAMFWSAIAAVVVMTTLNGGRQEASEARHTPHAPPAVESTTPAAGRSPSPTPPPLGRHLPRSRPIRLLIPKISVNAPFVDLAIGRTGQLEPPPAHDINLVGWYAKGASPGETGTSIIAGHVDTATSPAVFAGLSELEKGDRFHVLRADGRRASFEVDSVETFDKDHFPSERVYGDTPGAQVRLITCAGDYDRQVRDYTANLVVFAHLV
ncbi:class F sortase [Streptomyces sp. ISL-22]|uniref:class F sortase n=1 Tax=unclassified Streptomyces TaxID=2593676 RepID=UPI001BE551DB|nr:MULTISPECIES: class F sortase [unclassified Streptomyces]MBT2417036.1 class F sortase [Streptomyces sp. ISL-24]MBT2436112.1 class F sortase [Streptomyces sp. ISL-22]